jgi:hypothetical protein
MNMAAVLDGLLAVTAFCLAFRFGREFPGVRLGCILLGSAALLGALRFSGAPINPELHRFFSFLGAGVGLPLIAVTVLWPTCLVAATRRYAWIFAVIAAVLCVMFDIVVKTTLWYSAASILAAVTILWVGFARKEYIVVAAGLSLVGALLAFAAKLQIADLRPGDLLHIGLALGLALTGRWLVVLSATTIKNHKPAPYG